MDWSVLQGCVHAADPATYAGVDASTGLTCFHRVCHAVMLSRCNMYVCMYAVQGTWQPCGSVICVQAACCCISVVLSRPQHAVQQIQRNNSLIKQCRAYKLIHGETCCTCVYGRPFHQQRALKFGLSEGREFWPDYSLVKSHVPISSLGEVVRSSRVRPS